jgi:hypothetical protein
MNSAPVLVLLVFDAALLLASSVLSDREERPGDSVLLNVLFFCSGVPALIYQVVWQRALFAIYGVNAQSVGWWSPHSCWVWESGAWLADVFRRGSREAGF